MNKKDKNKTKEPIIEVLKNEHHFYQLFMTNAKKYPSEKLQLYELDNFMNELERSLEFMIKKTKKS